MSGEVEATLAEVLGEHGWTIRNTRGVCYCGTRMSKPDFNAHFAAVLAPVVRAASERAVEEALSMVAEATKEALSFDRSLRQVEETIKASGGLAELQERVAHLRDGGLS